MYRTQCLLTDEQTKCSIHLQGTVTLRLKMEADLQMLLCVQLLTGVQRMSKQWMNTCMRKRGVEWWWQAGGGAGP